MKIQTSSILTHSHSQSPNALYLHCDTEYPPSLLLLLSLSFQLSGASRPTATAAAAGSISFITSILSPSYYFALFWRLATAACFTALYRVTFSLIAFHLCISSATTSGSFSTEHSSRSYPQVPLLYQNYSRSVLRVA